VRISAKVRLPHAFSDASTLHWKQSPLAYAVAGQVRQYSPIPSEKEEEDLNKLETTGTEKGEIEEEELLVEEAFPPFSPGFAIPWRWWTTPPRGSPG